ncbi:glycoside hydrolase family protein [Gilvimarinus sp. DA14]|uniref:glycoside hydrolase family protein n=1 Tax=Gilvimarinus sp. DA14 TaxID=2956798 RepID=UPI0020B70D7C|nr:glycoside hydrolase family protein [Gilvimarinus sp. DA14]UTF58880.1 glycoside hydrolase family protein [Gilvimarinus sp. DA14]
MPLSKPSLLLVASALLCACSHQASVSDHTDRNPSACEGKDSLRMVDYFKPMPLGNQSDKVWGAEGVLPRDIDNGLESAQAQPAWNYWDGKIIKGPEGKYHLFASRWSGDLTHYDWSKSIAVHAIGDSPKGPYQNPQPFFSDRDGLGHNITGGVLPDGRYYVVASDAGRAGDVFISDTIDGEFELQGTVTMEANGQSLEHAGANVSIIVRPDDTFMLVSRPGIVMLSDDIMGPYVAQGPSIWPTIEGYDNSKAEDPIVWYSGGLYHITLNWWDIRKARHLVSRNGIDNWVDTGIAYDPRLGFEYTDGSKNTWSLLERPGVLVENGHVTHFTFSALDVNKWDDMGNDAHGSKVLVVPFDGKCFDRALDAALP